jgi:hypothetical protein
VETTKLTEQQSRRIAGLPGSDRVVGFDRNAPVVRRATGEMLRIQRDGRLTAATDAAEREFSRRLSAMRRRGGVEATTPYTQVMD